MKILRQNFTTKYPAHANFFEERLRPTRSIPPSGLNKDERRKWIRRDRDRYHSKLLKWISEESARLIANHRILETKEAVKESLDKQIENLKRFRADLDGAGHLLS